MSLRDKELVIRIEQLETLQAFQDDLLTQLNDTIIEQQFALRTLQEQLHLLSERLRVVTANPMALPQEETPPPHY